MTKLRGVLELLNNLTPSNIDDILKINKATLIDIKIYLHHAKDTIKFLQLKSQL